MVTFPSPLLCLYCDARIMPSTPLGCKQHMFMCVKHPAASLVEALKKIKVLSVREEEACTHEEERDLLDSRRDDIHALALGALRCE